MKGLIKRKELVLIGKHGRDFSLDITFSDTTVAGPVVIFSHGFKGFKDWGPFNEIATHFANEGFVFVKLNFAFNGTTPDNQFEFIDLDAFGHNNFTKELDDLEVVLDYLHQNSGDFQADISRISLIGHSRGGGISILKGAEDGRVKSVVTWASVAEFARHVTKPEIIHWKEKGVLLVENSRTNQMMPLYIQLYDDYLKNHRRLNIRNAVRHLSKPLLIVHGTEDDTVPFEHALELHQLSANSSGLIRIQGGDHTFGAAHPHQQGTLSSHFKEVLNETIFFLKSL